MKEIINFWGAVFLFGISFLTIAFPDDSIGKWLSDRASFLLIGFMLLAVIMLLLRQTKMMLAAFISCGLLAFSLKLATQHQITYEKASGGEQFSVLNVVMSDITVNPTTALSTIEESEADIIFFQEVDPWWHQELQNKFKTYTYQKITQDPENFMGIHVYSRLPVTRDSLLIYDAKTSLLLRVQLSKPVQIVNTYLYPAFSYITPASLDKHVDTLAQFSGKAQLPTILVGDLNQVQWSKTALDLKEKIGLQDSRIFTHLETPTDQIFYSSQMKCLKFRTLSNAYSDHIGIQAFFELNAASTPIQEKIDF